jgi:8-oxo-dGTP diphosphatase
MASAYIFHSEREILCRNGTTAALNAARMNNMTSLREWTVAAGIIRDDADQVLLVCNVRKNGHFDWSTPGGVVETGEEMVEALTREVIEETGIVVTEWTDAVYSVVAAAPGMGWHLTVQVHAAVAWSGDINIDDPDGIVTEAVFLDIEGALAKLADNAQWVREPISEWLTSPWTGHRQYGYELTGTDRANMGVVRHQ